MIFNNERFVIQTWDDVKLDNINYTYIRIIKTTPPDVNNHWILIHTKNYEDKTKLLCELQHDINFIRQLYYYPKNARLEYYKTWRLKPEELTVKL